VLDAAAVPGYQAGWFADDERRLLDTLDLVGWVPPPLPGARWREVLGGGGWAPLFWRPPEHREHALGENNAGQ